MPISRECHRKAHELVEVYDSVRRMYEGLRDGEPPSKLYTDTIFHRIEGLKEMGVIDDDTATDFRVRLQDVIGHLPAKIPLEREKRPEALEHSKRDAEKLAVQVESEIFQQVASCECPRR